VHLGAPASPVAYYQQVGRAGRATERADVLLLPAFEDREIWRYFATASMPRRADADAVLTALAESSKPMSTAALETVADVRRTRLELLLKVLDVEGAVRRVSGGWSSTGAGWTYDEQRYARVAEARDAEAASMLDYMSTDGCRMRFLQEALDDPGATDCGRCDRCAGPWYDASVPDGAVQAATRTLRKVGVPVEPRSQWPSGMSRLAVPRSGRISADEQVQQGRVVARLTDLGWGQRLRQLLAEQAPDAPADDRLLAACVEVLAGWGWEQRPVAVVAMPSLRRPQLVASVASHLARLGRLEDLGALMLTTQEPTGGPGGNSAFRLAAVHDRFAVAPALAARLTGLAGPVLLVDDLVDSRWTVTVAGALLRSAGAPGVLPFALAAAA
jgi:ATP-dependent DNA helicase RecQ